MDTNNQSTTDIIYNIEPEVVTYLEKLGYEYTTAMDVVCTIIENHVNDDNTAILESAVFKKYHESAIRAKAAFETAKQEFEASFDERGIVHGTWVLDYKSRKLRVRPHNNPQPSCCCNNNCNDTNNAQPDMQVRDSMPMRDSVGILRSNPEDSHN